MRRCIITGLILSLLLTGCALPGKEKQQYQATYLDIFDTVTSITARCDSEEDFWQQAGEIHDLLLRYHQLFDIYNVYEGLNNLKTVNDNAGVAPVAVDGEIIQLLKDCRDYYELTDHSVNVAMGRVLELWHEARSAGLDDPEHAALPEAAALKEAAAHSDWSAVEIDEEAGTVYLADPELRLDVGAVAKGWSAQRAAEEAPEGFLISVGGNVCATGPKDDSGTPWVVGITDPDGGSGYLHTLYDSDRAIVTSGDYQRYYVVDGVTYHHIIDPETLYPARRFCSVTVICQDSGLADALSTALFVLPREEGETLAQSCGAEAMWMDTEGNRFYTSGFSNWICG
ncbi:MAG: FAD:protein FMN transferase [Eubacteriales bacterium]|nr:FAD:protein FMN transferase [Eubacteriales bacterium]